MDFSLSPDQYLLQDSVNRLLLREYDFATRTAIVAQGGYSATKWRQFAELGWLGAGIAESAGGYGGSPVETMVIMEAFGRRLVVEPFLWTAVVGAQLLAALPGGQRAALTEQMLAGNLHLTLATCERHSGFNPARVATHAVRTNSGWTIDGAKTVVPNGAIANKIFVSARTSGGVVDPRGITLFVIDRGATGITLRPCRTHDGHNAAEMFLDSVEVSEDAIAGAMDEGLDIIERASDFGIAALCAEAMGSAAHLLEATVSYLRTREQYGGPLARLQALQHRLAEMYVATALLRSMAHVATMSLELPEIARKRALSGAKVQAIQSLRFVAQQAVQLHGGMGVSEEMDIAHHLKRATVSAMLLGDEAYHLARYAALDEALADA